MRKFLFAARLGSVEVKTLKVCVAHDGSDEGSLTRLGAIDE